MNSYPTFVTEFSVHLQATNPDIPEDTRCQGVVPADPRPPSQAVQVKFSAASSSTLHMFRTTYLCDFVSFVSRSTVQRVGGK